MTTPEDTILSKLEWAKRGDSDLQLRDASLVFAANEQTLDIEYLDKWAARLGIEEHWARARAQPSRLTRVEPSSDDVGPVPGQSPFNPDSEA